MELEYLKVANNPIMWISVLPGVLLVIVQAIVLSRRAIVSGRKMGITERQFKSAIRSSALASIGPSRTFIAPLALTVFVWVTLMNAIDLIPVDLIPAICGWFGIHYMRPLPTADLNGSMGISVGVLLLMIYYGIKIKGPAGFGKELFTAPFGNFILLWPFNFLLNIIEYLAKTVSLGMRLFGNMYAGELLFFLIALLTGMLWEGEVGLAAFGVLGQFFAGLCWWLFHILIVLLQAFIMMMLTLVYIGQSHEGH